MEFYLSATLKRKINIKELEVLAAEYAIENNPKGHKKLVLNEYSPTCLEITYKRHPQYGLKLQITKDGHTITSFYRGYPPNVCLGHNFLVDLVIKYGGHIFDWDSRMTCHYSRKTKKWSEPEEFDESLLR